jgi:hypothetical protein
MAKNLLLRFQKTQKPKIIVSCRHFRSKKKSPAVLRFSNGPGLSDTAVAVS